MSLGMSQADADDSGFRGSNEGSKLAGNTDLWTDGVLDTNAEFGTSGFKALPAGYRYSSNGESHNLGYYGCWWSSTQYDSNHAYTRYLSCDYANVRRTSHDKSYGFLVRCLKD